MRCKCGSSLKCRFCFTELSHWISVEDQLPEDDQVVLMLEEGHDGLPVIGFYYCLECIPGFYPSGIFTIRMHVTHWMPVPKRKELN